MKWHGEYNGTKFYLHDESGFFFSEDKAFYIMPFEHANAIWMWIDGLIQAAQEETIRQCREAAHQDLSDLESELIRFGEAARIAARYRETLPNLNAVADNISVQI